MNKLVYILVAVFSLSLFAQSQTAIEFEMNDGSRISYPISEIDEITFPDNEEMKLSILFQPGEEFTSIKYDVKDVTFKINETQDSLIVIFSPNQFITQEQYYSFEGIDKIVFEDNSDEINYDLYEFEVDEVLIDGLGQPWGIDFINSNEIIFTEKSGKLWHYNISENQRNEITHDLVILTNGQGGLLDVTLHPNFADNKLVYLTHSISASGGATTVAARGKLEGFTLVETEEIFRALPAIPTDAHFGSRLVFDSENKIYVSIGDRRNRHLAQDSTNHIGKVVRLNDDGSIPSDNPFANSGTIAPEIFTFGHRNIQGMDVHPITGEIWAVEHGPQGGDELNRLIPGANYGWPLLTFGEEYGGGEITPDTSRPGYEDPITYWVPSIAPCGMTFLKTSESANYVDLVIANMASRHLHRLIISEDNEVIDRNRSLENYQRLRDVAQAPDGTVYVLAEFPGRLIKLKRKE